MDFNNMDRKEIAQILRQLAFCNSNVSQATQFRTECPNAEAYASLLCSPPMQPPVEQLWDDLEKIDEAIAQRKKQSTTFFIIAGIILILTIIAGILNRDFFVLFIFVVPFVVLGFLMSSRSSAWELRKAQHIQDNESRLENYKQNCTIYENLLSTYHLQYEEKKKEYPTVLANINSMDEESRAYIYEYRSIISSEYDNALEDIADILDSGRADTLKEALNVYRTDVYQQKMLMLQENSAIAAQETAQAAQKTAQAAKVQAIASTVSAAANVATAASAATVAAESRKQTDIMRNYANRH